jgi:hypothetical protein
VKTALIGNAYGLVVVAVALIAFFAANLAGTAGTPAFYVPTAQIFAVGLIFHSISLLLFRRRKA